MKKLMMVLAMGIMSFTSVQAQQVKTIEGTQKMHDHTYNQTVINENGVATNSCECGESQEIQLRVVEYDGFKYALIGEPLPYTGNYLKYPCVRLDTNEYWFIIMEK